MRFIFCMGHPAHFHLYKNTISEILQQGHSIKIVISNKDILKNLLDESGFSYDIIALSSPNESVLAKGKKIIKSSFKMLSICRAFKPDLIIGCLSQMGIVGFFLGIPTIFNAEDDITYTLLQAIVSYPFITHILSPKATNVGFFSYKRIAYDGYHKLAYLHPKRFQSDIEFVKKNLGLEKYCIIRLVNLNAYHDIKAQGISEQVLLNLINKIEKYCAVFITSEKPLSAAFEQYRLNINPKDMHHYLSNAALFIGDSQSMTVESAMLGIPNIKYNTFAGKISVLEELENKYQLTIGLSPTQESKLLDEVDKILSNFESKNIYHNRRQKMLTDKIDVTAFFTWFFTNYPNSISIMQKKDNFQYNFK